MGTLFRKGRKGKEVREMVLVFLFVTTIISSIGWLCCWVASATLVKYIKDRSYTPPSDKEMKECCSYVLKKLLHIK